MIRVRDGNKVRAKEGDRDRKGQLAKELARQNINANKLPSRDVHSGIVVR